MQNVYCVDTDITIQARSVWTLLSHSARPCLVIQTTASYALS